MATWSEDLIPVERARTLDGLFHQRVRRSPERVAYRWLDRQANDWRALTWRETAAAVARWRTAMAAEGLEPGDRVAILLRNCPDWVVIDQAALSLGLVTVPLYTDDRADNAAYILQDAAVKLLCIQDANRWRRLAEVIGDDPWPQRVVIVDGREGARQQAAGDPRAVAAADWLPAADAGHALPAEQRDGDPNALATIVYTSGTTGRPKGVMLSHDNILSNAHGAVTVVDVYQEDVFLSFLPMSHTLERTASLFLPMMTGSEVAYARSVTQLGEDLQVIRPTVIIAVPRVFERVYQRIQGQLEGRSRLAQRLFRLAVDVGWLRFEVSQGRRGWHPKLLLWPLLKRKVAAPVMARLGGRMRAAVSGGAALPFEVGRVFIGLGLPLLQGYGLTETSPVISVNPLQDNRPQSVGRLLRGIRARIGPDEELQVLGPCNMLGYWNNHAATARIIGSDGWLRTGDQARIDNGYIYITGRIKDILVLSNGEKVPPGDMEMALGLDPLFEQVMVIGEGHSYLSALAVLNADLWPGLAREYGLAPEDPASLDDPELHKEMLRRMREALADFPGYAKIRRVGLTLEPWTIDNGLQTPTMKIKRHQVLERYQGTVERMYEGERG
ncbi:AMP-dependent synthetase/ligase [Thiohalocapsa halophila]